MKEPQTTQVLVVDDDTVLRDAIAFEIQRRGYQVLTAHSGNSAFAMTQKQKFDIVVSDIRMPDGDGVALLKKLRAINGVEPTVFLMTGFSDFNPEELVLMGARRVFSKPFDRSELIKAIDGVIGYDRPPK